MPVLDRDPLALDSKALAVGKLGEAVGVVASVASFHLSKLKDAGFVSTSRRGRRTMVRRVEARWRQVVDALWP